MSPPPLPPSYDADAVCNSSSLLARNRLGSRAIHTEAVEALGIATIATCYAINFVCVTSWWMFKANYARTRVRPSVLIYLASLASLLQSVSGLAPLIWPDEIPCLLWSVCLVLVVPVVGGSIAGKLVLFYFLAVFSRAAAQVAPALQRANEEEERQEEKSGSGGGRRVRPSPLMKSPSIMIVTDASGNKGLCRPANLPGNMFFVGVKSVLYDPLPSSSDVAGPDPKLSDAERIRLLYTLRFFISRTGRLYLVGCLMAPFVAFTVIYAAVTPALRLCSGCAMFPQLQGVMIAFGAICVVVGTALAWRTRTLRDPWRIQREASLTMVCAVIAFVGFLVNAGKPRTGTDTFDAAVIVAIGLILNLLVQSLLPLVLAAREEGIKWDNPVVVRLVRWSKRGCSDHKGSGGIGGSNTPFSSTASMMSDNASSVVAFRHGPMSSTLSSASARRVSALFIDSVNRGDLTIDLILQNPDLAALFEAYLVSEFAVEMLLFYRDASAWKRNYPDVSGSANISRARRIYTNYLQPGAIYELNVSDHQRQRVERGLASAVAADSPPSPVSDTRNSVDVGLFEQVLREVAKLLNSGAVLRFKSTIEYRRFATVVVGGTRENQEGVAT